MRWLTVLIALTACAPGCLSPDANHNCRVFDIPMITFSVPL